MCLLNETRTSTYFIFIFFVESLELYSRFCMWISAYLTNLTNRLWVGCEWSKHWMLVLFLFFTTSHQRTTPSLLQYLKGIPCGVQQVEYYENSRTSVEKILLKTVVQHFKECCRVCYWTQTLARHTRFVDPTSFNRCVPVGSSPFCTLIRRNGLMPWEGHGGVKCKWLML